MIHAVDEHRRLILGRRRLDHLLRPGFQVLAAALVGEKQAGRLDDHIGVHAGPVQLGGVLDGAEADAAAIDDQFVAVDHDVAGELAVHPSRA